MLKTLENYFWWLEFCPTDERLCRPLIRSRTIVPLSVTASPRHLLYLDTILVLALNWGVRGWMAIHPRTAALSPVTFPNEHSWGARDHCRLSHATQQSVEFQSHKQDRLL
jgi:hypothetical protein